MKSLWKHACLLLLVFPMTWASAQTREEKVRADKAKVESEGFWIYNDFDEAVKQSRQTGKPILAALRCIPCHECVKIDDDLIDTAPVLQPLLKQFVCVRMVSTNGLDLDTFQYDTDQSFAMFMLNSDRTIYGRFGTRSHRTDWVGDVSIEGMARALEGALELHANYPSNRNQLAGKRGRPLEFSSPELFPSLKEKYSDALNYEGDVVKSCIHCHQIGDARREYYWHRSEPIPDELLFPYPHPKSIGLVLDPTQKATVRTVTSNSPAEQAGLQSGDSIQTMNGQPLLSMADVQWVLHHLDNQGANVEMQVKRGQTELQLTLPLESGWRTLDNTRWRVSSWLHSRMALGGMRLETLTDEERKQSNVPPGMALRVTSLGRYGPHATARKAGFKEGDILTHYDGQSSFHRESDIFAHTAKRRKIGDSVQVRLLRGSRQLSLRLPIQK